MSCCFSRALIPLPRCWLLLVLTCWQLNVTAVAQVGLIATSLPLQRGYAPIPHISPYNMESHLVAASQEKALIKTFCERLTTYFQKYRWDKAPCGQVAWQADLKSTDGHPLIYATFGKGREGTVFFGGVHPDELTPVELSFRFARYLHEHADLYEQHGLQVIIAPLVNPDGFLRENPRRTARHIDVNRNFFTMDWYDKAQKAWRQNQRGLPRYFPGYFPHTEIETFFQVKLIDMFAPDKIFSVHAPLGFLDYDGPGDQKPHLLSQNERRAKEFVYSISKKTRDYRVVDYSFYPGSLGNYAGNERNLPTITLELETTLPSQVGHYWEQFLPGFVQSFQYPFRKKQDKINDNATRFFSVYDEIMVERNAHQG